MRNILNNNLQGLIGVAGYFRGFEQKWDLR